MTSMRQHNAISSTFKSAISLVIVLTFLSNQIAWAAPGYVRRGDASEQSLAPTKQDTSGADIILALAIKVQDFLKATLGGRATIPVEELQNSLVPYLNAVVRMTNRKNRDLGFVLEADASHLLQLPNGGTVISVGLYDQRANERLVLLVADKGETNWKFVDENKNFKKIREPETVANLVIASYRYVGKTASPDPNQPPTNEPASNKKFTRPEAFLGAVVAGLVVLSHATPAPAAPVEPAPLVIAQAQEEGEEEGPSALEILRGGLKKETAKEPAEEVSAPAEAPMPSSPADLPGNIMKEWNPQWTGGGMSVDGLPEGGFRYSKGLYGWGTGPLPEPLDLSKRKCINVIVRRSSSASLKIEFKDAGDNILFKEDIGAARQGGVRVLQTDLGGATGIADKFGFTDADGTTDVLAVIPSSTANAQPDMSLEDWLRSQKATRPMPPARPAPTRQVEIAPEAPEAVDVSRLTFPGNLLTKWKPKWVGGGMTVQKTPEGGYVFDNGPYGWATGPMPQTKLSEHPYMKVVARRRADTASIKMEFKDGRDQLLLPGGKEDIDFPEKDKWYVIQINTGGIEGIANKFGFSDATGPVEILAVFPSDKPNTQPVMPLDDWFRDVRGALPTTPMEKFMGYIGSYPVVNWGESAQILSEINAKENPQTIEEVQGAILKELRATVSEEETSKALQDAIDSGIRVEAGLPSPLPAGFVSGTAFEADPVKSLVFLLTFLGLTLKVLPEPKRLRAHRLAVLYIAFLSFTGDVKAQEALVTGASRAALQLSRDYDFSKPEDQAAFIRDVVVKNESPFIERILDPDTGIPEDKLLVDPLTWSEMSAKGQFPWTAASKQSLTIPFLMKAILQEKGFEHSEVTREEALDLLEEELTTIRKFLDDNPYTRGLLPWVDLKEGKLVHSSAMLPMLDNGEMIWALAALQTALKDSTDSKEVAIRNLADNLIARHNYGPFFSKKMRLLTAEAHFTDKKTGEMDVDKTYHLSDMHEGIMAVLWGVLHGQIPQEAWDNLKIPITSYTTQDGEVVDTLRGHRASFHEQWPLAFLPIMESDLGVVFRNYLIVQADNANRLGLPGFVTTGFGPQDTYIQAGPLAIARKDLKEKAREDVASPFATSMAMLIDRQVGLVWLKNILTFPGMSGSPYGAPESVAHDGWSGVMSMDAKGMTLLAGTGGVVPWVNRYLETHNVPGTSVTMKQRLTELLNAKFQQALRDNNLTKIRTSAKPIPRPKPLSEQIKPKVKPLPISEDTLDVIADFRFDDLGKHGEHFNAISNPSNAWERRPDGSIIAKYSIESGQFAYLGGYQSGERRAAEYNWVEITIPADTPPQKYTLEFKAENIPMAHVEVDTKLPGKLFTGADGRQYKTLGLRIQFPLPYATIKPLNYVAIAMHDPARLMGEYAKHAREGTLEINKIVLSKKAEAGAPKIPPVGSESGSVRFGFGKGPLESKADYDRGVYWVGTEAAGFRWTGGDVTPPQNVSGYRFVNIKVCNLAKNSAGEPERNHFQLEIKSGANYPFTGRGNVGKKRIDLPAHNDWITIQIRIKEGVKDPFNFFGVSDNIGPFEILMDGVGFTNKEIEGKIIRHTGPEQPAAAPTEEKKPAEAPAPAKESIDGNKLFNLLQQDVTNFESAMKAGNAQSASDVLKKIEAFHSTNQRALTTKAREVMEQLLANMRERVGSLGPVSVEAPVSVPAPGAPVSPPEPSPAPATTPAPTPAGLPPIGSIQFPGNIMEGWNPEWVGGGMTVDTLDEGGFRYDKGRYGWGTGPLAQEVDLSQYKYVKVVARRPGSGGLKIELKDQSDKALLKEDIGDPKPGEWCVLQIDLNGKQGIADKFGFTDANGATDVRAVFFSNTPNPEPVMTLEKWYKELRGALPVPLVPRNTILQGIGYILDNVAGGNLTYTYGPRKGQHMSLDDLAQTPLYSLERVLRAQVGLKEDHVAAFMAAVQYLAALNLNVTEENLAAARAKVSTEKPGYMPVAPVPAVPLGPDFFAIAQDIVTQNITDYIYPPMPSALRLLRAPAPKAIPRSNQWLYSLYREHAYSGDLAKVRGILRGKYVSPKKKTYFSRSVRDDLAKLFSSNKNLKDSDIEALVGSKDLTSQEAEDIRLRRIRILATYEIPEGSTHDAEMLKLVTSGLISEAQRKKIWELRLQLKVKAIMALEDELRRVQEEIGMADARLMDEVWELQEEAVEAMPQEQASEPAAPAAASAVKMGAVARGAEIIALALGLSLAATNAPAGAAVPSGVGAANDKARAAAVSKAKIDESLRVANELARSGAISKELAEELSKIIPGFDARNPKSQEFLEHMADVIRDSKGSITVDLVKKVFDKAMSPIVQETLWKQVLGHGKDFDIMTDLPEVMDYIWKALQTKFNYVVMKMDTAGKVRYEDAAGRPVSLDAEGKPVLHPTSPGTKIPADAMDKGIETMAELKMALQKLVPGFDVRKPEHRGLLQSFADTVALSEGRMTVDQMKKVMEQVPVGQLLGAAQAPVGSRTELISPTSKKMYMHLLDGLRLPMPAKGDVSAQTAGSGVVLYFDARHRLATWAGQNSHEVYIRSTEDGNVVIEPDPESGRFGWAGGIVEHSNLSEFEGVELEVRNLSGKAQSVLLEFKNPAGLYLTEELIELSDGLDEAKKALSGLVAGRELGDTAYEVALGKARELIIGGVLNEAQRDKALKSLKDLVANRKAGGAWYEAALAKVKELVDSGVLSKVQTIQVPIANLGQKGALSFVGFSRADGPLEIRSATLLKDDGKKAITGLTSTAIDAVPVTTAAAQAASSSDALDANLLDSWVPVAVHDVQVVTTVQRKFLLGPAEDTGWFGWAGGFPIPKDLSEFDGAELELHNPTDKPILFVFELKDGNNFRTKHLIRIPANTPVAIARLPFKGERYKGRMNFMAFSAATGRFGVDRVNLIRRAEIKAPPVAPPTVPGIPAVPVAPVKVGPQGLAPETAPAKGLRTQTYEEIERDLAELQDQIGTFAATQQGRITEILRQGRPNFDSEDMPSDKNPLPKVYREIEQDLIKLHDQIGTYAATQKSGIEAALKKARASSSKARKYSGKGLRTQVYYGIEQGLADLYEKIEILAATQQSRIEEALGTLKEESAASVRLRLYSIVDLRNNLRARAYEGMTQDLVALYNQIGVSVGVPSMETVTPAGAAAKSPNDLARAGSTTSDQFRQTLLTMNDLAMSGAVSPAQFEGLLGKINQLSAAGASRTWYDQLYQLLGPVKDLSDSGSISGSWLNRLLAKVNSLFLGGAHAYAKLQMLATSTDRLHVNYVVTSLDDRGKIQFKDVAGLPVSFDAEGRPVFSPGSPGELVSVSKDSIAKEWAAREALIEMLNRAISDRTQFDVNARDPILRARSDGLVSYFTDQVTLSDLIGAEPVITVDSLRQVFEKVASPVIAEKLWKEVLGHDSTFDPTKDLPEVVAFVSKRLVKEVDVNGRMIVLPADYFEKKVAAMAGLKPVIEAKAPGFDMNRPEHRGLLESLADEVVLSEGKLTVEMQKQIIEKTLQGMPGSKLDALLGTGGVVSQAPPVPAGVLSAAAPVEENLGVMGEYQIVYKSYQDASGEYRYGLFAHKAGTPFPAKPFQSFGNPKKRYAIANTPDGPVLLLVIGEDIPNTDAGTEPTPSYSQLVFTVDEEGEIIRATTVTGDVGEHSGSILEVDKGILQYHKDGDDRVTRVALFRVIEDARRNEAAFRARRPRGVAPALAAPVTEKVAPSAAPVKPIREPQVSVPSPEPTPVPSPSYQQMRETPVESVQKIYETPFYSFLKRGQLDQARSILVSLQARRFMHTMTSADTRKIQAIVAAMEAKLKEAALAARPKPSPAPTPSPSPVPVLPADEMEPYKKLALEFEKAKREGDEVKAHEVFVELLKLFQAREKSLQPDVKAVVGVMIKGMRIELPKLSLTPSLPGKDLTRPLAEGEVISGEATNKAIRRYLSQGVYARKFNGREQGLLRRAELKPSGSLEYHDISLFAAGRELGKKLTEVENLIRSGQVDTELPPGVTRDQLLNLLYDAEILMPQDVGDDVFAHTGFTHKQIYIGSEMIINASTRDVALLLLEEAKHLILNDPNHEKIKHDEGLRQRLLTVTLMHGKRAREIGHEMAMFRASKSPNGLASVAKPKDVAIAGYPSVVYLTVGPDFMVNLHEEIDARRGRNIKVVPVYRESFMRSFDYLTTLAKEFPGVLMPPMDVDSLQARAPGQSLEEAAIAYAREIVPERKAEAKDIGWINSADKTYRIEVAKKPRILEVTPKPPQTDEVINVGSLIDVTEIGILARRLAGDRYEALTFAELADLLDPAFKPEFLTQLSALGIESGQTVASFVKDPMPVKGGSAAFQSNVNSLKIALVAA